LSADQLLTYLSWLMFIIIFVVVTAQAIRRPNRAHLDIALLFAAPVLIIAIAIGTLLGVFSSTGVAAYLASSALLSLPYLLVRLVDDIIVAALWVRRSI